MKTRLTLLGAIGALGALALAGSAHADVMTITQGSFDATPNQVYDVQPYTVTVGETSSATNTDNVRAGRTVTYDFNFQINKTLDTTAFGSFGLNKVGEAFDSANLQLFRGTANADGTVVDGGMTTQNPMFITGVSYDPGSDAQQSINTVLDAGAYFVQIRAKASDTGPGGPLTFSATVHRVSAAPEPSTWLLMMAGVGGLGLALRSRRNAGGSLRLA